MLQRIGASVAVLSLSLFVASSSSALSSYTNLLVFGDSLVDVGNTQALALAFSQPDPTPAASGYDGGRFTNGITFADMVNVAVEGTNTVRSGASGDNYAYGGARARSNGDFLPDVAAQVSAYLGATGGVADPGALYLINVGGNDVRDITLGGLVGAARQAVIDAAKLAVTTSVTTLQAAGASSIMFVGIGNVGAIPEILALGGGAPAAGTAASTDLNNAIQAALPASVGFFDTMALMAALGLNPAAYGLPAGINLTNACLGSGTPNPAGPPTCTSYAFFDAVHPTSAVSQVIGTNLIAAIPEPGTVSLVAIGLIAIGILRRARH